MLWIETRLAANKEYAFPMCHGSSPAREVLTVAPNYKLHAKNVFEQNQPGGRGRKRNLLNKTPQNRELLIIETSCKMAWHTPYRKSSSFVRRKFKMGANAAGSRSINICGQRMV